MQHYSSRGILVFLKAMRNQCDNLEGREIFWAIILLSISSCLNLKGLFKENSSTTKDGIVADEFDMRMILWKTYCNWELKWEEREAIVKTNDQEIFDDLCLYSCQDRL